VAAFGRASLAPAAASVPESLQAGDHPRRRGMLVQGQAQIVSQAVQEMAQHGVGPALEGILQHKVEDGQCAVLLPVQEPGQEHRGEDALQLDGVDVVHAVDGFIQVGLELLAPALEIGRLDPAASQPCK